MKDNSIQIAFFLLKKTPNSKDISNPIKPDSKIKIMNPKNTPSTGIEFLYGKGIEKVANTGKPMFSNSCKVKEPGIKISCVSKPSREIKIPGTKPSKFALSSDALEIS